MSDWYRLEGKMPVRCKSFIEAAVAFEDVASRRVALSIIGDLRVSTVFLGMDHSWGDGPPILFETMIFGGPNDQHQDRCSTWEEAEEMHKKAVDLVKSTSPAPSP